MAECGQMTPSLLEMIASTLRKDADGNIFFNTICYEVACATMESAFDCGADVSDLEAFIVANGFGVDSCGYPAIKLRVCDSTDAENREQ